MGSKQSSGHQEQRGDRGASHLGRFARLSAKRICPFICLTSSPCAWATESIAHSRFRDTANSRAGRRPARHLRRREGQLVDGCWEPLAAAAAAAAAVVVVRAWAPKRKLKEVSRISMCSRHRPGACLFFFFSALSQTHTHGHVRGSGSPGPKHPSHGRGRRKEEE